MIIIVHDANDKNLLHESVNSVAVITDNFLPLYMLLLLFPFHCKPLQLMGCGE